MFVRRKRRQGAPRRARDGLALLIGPSAVLLVGRVVHEHGVDLDAFRAQVVDDAQALRVDVSPVGDVRALPHPGNEGDGAGRLGAFAFDGDPLRDRREVDGRVLVLKDDDEVWLVGGFDAVADRDALVVPAAGRAVLRVKVGEVDPGWAAGEPEIVLACQGPDECLVAVQPLAVEAGEGDLPGREPGGGVGGEPSRRVEKQGEVGTGLLGVILFELEIEGRRRSR